MKRKLAGLLCFCVLFSGCGIGSSHPLQTEPPITEFQPTQNRPPLLEQGTVLKESSHLRYIPNTAVESMHTPEVRLFGNGLLLSECREEELVLNLISLEDGSTVAEGSITASPGTTLCIGNNEIGLCDRESGRIAILDEHFRLLRTYDVTGLGDSWYLNSELDTLHIFFSDRGLLAYNLETRDEIWLVDNGFRVEPIGSTNSYVIFAYTDRADQKTYTRCLNLSSSTLETLPIDGAISSGIRLGETWLLEAENIYTVVQNESAYTFSLPDSGAVLLSPRRHLLVTDASRRNLSLYEPDGAFLSQCALPQNSHAVVGMDFVWSGYWEGYFFVDIMDSSCRLMFWDVFAETEGENLTVSSSGQTRIPQTVLEYQLYERAVQLSDRFGVDIRIAEQCSLNYSHYNTSPLTDPVFIRSALDVLEDSLSLYPEGFFRQLTYGSLESIRIELVSGLTAKDEIDTHPESAGGFAQPMNNSYVIVLDGFLLRPQMLFHEISHIIDGRLKWDSMIREDALYCEEAWLALQPEGFRYAMSYTEMPRELLAFMESRYFITEYSLTYPTEDRAVLMESAMCNHTWEFESGFGTRTKLQYYADCIRDCFDTEGWPEVTMWEQILE